MLGLRGGCCGSVGERGLERGGSRSPGVIVGFRRGALGGG